MNMREIMAIGQDKMDVINNYLTDENNPLVNDILELIEEYGGVEEINKKAAEHGSAQHLIPLLKDINSPYVADLEWLMGERDKGSFASIEDYCSKIGVNSAALNYDNEVTIEISAAQYFPWIIEQARHCIATGEMMPGRIIRVRNMVEGIADNGDVMATAAAMDIMGCTWVDTMNTNGTDGSNIHLNGPETITGYFGGIGQPNDHPITWMREYLEYFTKYGVKQVLNINPGTVLVGYMVNKLGINHEFKMSVFMGMDNPYSILWTLMTAKMFSRPDDTTSIVGFNLSNSVNSDTIRAASEIREALGLTDKVRLEHHITECYTSIVRQPYLRRDQVVELAQDVPNIAAKHEGGDPEDEAKMERPSSILDYFLPKKEIVDNGWMEPMRQTYMCKHAATVNTSNALLKSGVAVGVAKNLHK